MLIKLLKHLRELTMKRKKMKGRSARHGKAASPYTKYGKVPHRYSPDYYNWKRSVVAKANSRNKYAQEAVQDHRG